MFYMSFCLKKSVGDLKNILEKQLNTWFSDRVIGNKIKDTERQNCRSVSFNFKFRIPNFEFINFSLH